MFTWLLINKLKCMCRFIWSCWFNCHICSYYWLYWWLILGYRWNLYRLCYWSAYLYIKYSIWLTWSF